MNKIPIQRIVFAVIITAAICFVSPIYLEMYDMPNMSMIEFMFKFDKAFFMENNFDMVRVMNNGANGIWFTVFLPLTVSITGLFSFGDTMQGFWRLEYIRGSKRSYRVRNFLNVCGVGAMGVTLGYLLYTLMVIPFFPYYTPFVIPAHDGLPEEIINSRLTGLEFLGEIFSKLGILFLFSFLTAAICLCIFLAMKNQIGRAHV